MEPNRIFPFKSCPVEASETIDEPENNPYPTNEVFKKVLSRFINEINVGDIEVIEIPPIESVNYGRDVGYTFNELKPSEEIREISATDIRRKNDIII